MNIGAGRLSDAGVPPLPLPKGRFFIITARKDNREKLTVQTAAKRGKEGVQGVQGVTGVTGVRGVHPVQPEYCAVYEARGDEQSLPRRRPGVVGSSSVPISASSLNSSNSLNSSFF